MFLSTGTPCRLAIGPDGKPVIVTHDGSRVALVPLTAPQTQRLAQAASNGAGK
jgi:antitoxin (DNA-binding transcriptional repressor) of toxin-antitoxin stability system